MTTQPMQRASSEGGGQSVVWWMWTWIVLGILVVVTVIGFLIGIVRSLESIDDGLLEARNAVQGAGGDVQPLPQHVQKINDNLTKIDTALKPIRFQANEISSGLELITSSLVSIDGSLKDTSGSLVDTSGSLADTSGILVNASGLVQRISGSLIDTSNVLSTVLARAGQIEGTLEAAQNIDNLGTNLIWRQVDAINGVLVPAQADTSNISRQLDVTNANLTSICVSPTLTITGVLAGQPRC